MEWVKYMTKTDGMEISLVYKFGSDGYHVYRRTVSLLAEGNYFHKPMLEERGFFIHTFICVSGEKIEEIYRWLSEQKDSDGNPKFEFKLVEGDKFSVFIPKLEQLNPAYAARHAEIIEQQRASLGAGKRLKKSKSLTVENPNPEVLKFVETWNKLADEYPHIVGCKKLTPKRHAEILESLEDEWVKKNWLEAMSKMWDSKFLTGQIKRNDGDHKNWRPTLDWFLRGDGRKTATIVKIIDGEFDDERGKAYGD